MILTKWGVNYNFKATTALCRKAITYDIRSSMLRVVVWPKGQRILKLCAL